MLASTTDLAWIGAMILCRRLTPVERRGMRKALSRYMEVPPDITDDALALTYLEHTKSGEVPVGPFVKPEKP